MNKCLEQGHVAFHFNQIIRKRRSMNANTAIRMHGSSRLTRGCFKQYPQHTVSGNCSTVCGRLQSFDIKTVTGIASSTKGTGGYAKVAIRTENKFVLSYLPTYVDNVALPAFARRTPLLHQSTDISCPSVLLTWAPVGTDGRTDGHRTVS